MKLATAILLFGIVCSAFNIDSVYRFEDDDDDRELDQAQNFNLPENDDGDEFESEFADNDDVLETLNDDELGEMEAIQEHVKYQDGARSALLEFARKLRKGKNVTNAFLKVIDTFEKEIAEFYAALRQRAVKRDLLSDIKNFIKKASEDRTANTKILRDLTSEGLFVAQKVEEFFGGSKRDFLSLGAAEFLNNIKEEIGEETFDEFLSVNGLVTLMFTIDNTGSMGGEIRAAIAISEQIVRADRTNYDVDYILSPFNDPETGPITRKKEGEGEEFIAALRRLQARGGGDCPELAFKGMLNALEAGPQPGSSMFVFTDAFPKDSNEENNNAVLDIASDLDIKINFFTSRGCNSTDGFRPFRKVAQETGGVVYPFHNTLDLKKLGELVSLSVRSPASIGSGSGGSSSRKRRAPVKEYSISVDDSIEKISVTVKTENSGTGIKLLDPNGKVVVSGRVDLTKGVVFNIDSPITGVYKLVVPAGAGKHEYKVSGVSEINVDFGHLYVFIAKRGTRIPVPLDQPLQGLPAKVFITIAGAESVKAGSLRIKVVNDKGAVHADKALTAVGTSGVRYFFRFDPPSGPFKLQVHGQTKKGSSFVRETSRHDQTVPVVMKLSYREDSKIIRRGRENTVVVKIIRGKIGSNRQGYELSLKSERGYSATYRSPKFVWRGRGGFVRIKIVVPADAPAGKTENFKLSLTRADETMHIASLIFSFLLV